MALIALEEQRLRSIGAYEFFTKHRATYKAMAKEAYAFTATTLRPTHQQVRVDDVSGHLEASIELDQPLKAFLAAKRKSQQYWTRYFTFLILDELWKELKDEYEGS